MANATRSSALPPLDECQREAVTSPPGPLLVVAGAGSGKTRVLTERAAWLCEQDLVGAEAVLVITFTNRAAAELRRRLGALVGHGRARQMTVGTIHAACHGMVRRHARRAGRTPRFSIYDPSEARRLVTQALSDEGVSDRREAKALALQIGKAKARLVGPEAYAALLSTERTQRFARAFVRYERYLAASDALDLDDLVVRAVALLSEPDLLDGYQDRFRAVLVDEFQDVNRAQYEWIRRLAAGHRNLTATGDDDQAIYRFRSADVRNLLDFERDFPDARVVALERNYRSSGRIVRCAAQLAEHNERRRRKRMWTPAPDGVPIAVVTAPDERSEARATAAWCRERLGQGVAAQAIAVLFRTRAQGTALEDALLEAAVPYRLVGSRGLWETAAVRDLIAHLTLLVNPRDRLALARALPLRKGVGAKAVERVIVHGSERNGDLVEACARAHTIVGLRGRQADAVHEFGRNVRTLAEQL
nr:UvrD-helicase domain-containing protein [Thermoleophilaceae bacterium]